MVGKTLGHYKVIEPLGAGGMGEVYLGEDTRLGRKVAIKVLPEEYASDPERLARFEQEARAAAALNHPHIAVVHDVGSETGDDGTVTHFIVQEYLKGQSLRERLDKGALPLDKALDLATEVGEALIAAHKAGIIHRDLKPDNIFVTEEGHAKVLDFGLAKLTEMAAPTGSSASMSPTMLGTVAGQVMGTAGYMSPEQVNGETVDTRSDLFAFGAVLYETVTGRRAFAGKSIPDTLSRILHDDPGPLTEVDASLPFELQRIVKKSLAKEPAKRYQAAGELVIDLQALGADVESGTAMPVGGQPVIAPVTVETTRGISWKLGVPIAVSIAVVAALTGWWLAPPGSGGSLPQIFYIDLPEGTRLPAGRGSGIAISPDGQNIAYMANGPAGRHLYLRRLDRLGSTLIPGTEEAINPTFSPDGESLAFGVGSTLKRVPRAGGEPLTLCTMCVGEASWGDAGDLIFVKEGELWRVPEVGGTPKLVTGPMPDRGVPYFLRPLVLPGGKAVLFEPGVVGANAGAAVISLESKEVVVVARDGSDPFYSDTGHVVFARGDTLFAVPFDLDRLRVTGEPVPVVQGVRVEAGGALHAAVSRNGVLVYAPGAAASGASLFSVDRSGARELLTMDKRAYTSPRISLDGDSIAVHVADAAGGDIWILEIEPGTLRRLTKTTDARDPVWMRDGFNVTYLRDAPGSRSVESVLADGSGSPATIRDVGTDPVASPQSWALDDSRLVVQVENDLMVLTVGDDSALTPLFDTDFQTHSASVSHDGKWVAYVSDVSGSQEVYVRRFPGGGAEHKVSNGGGRAPVWSSDDSELFYKGSNQLVAVSVRKEPEWQILGSEPLFDLSFFSYIPDPSRAQYDVFADSQRFVMLSYQQSMQDTLRINVVLNWFFEELKQRVAPGGR